MNARSRGCAIAVLVVVLAGCWGKAAIDLSGTYHVDSHVASACTTDQPVTAPVAYLRFISAAGGYEMQACSTIEAASCTSIADFTEPADDDGWRRYEELLVVTSDGAAECELRVIDGAALLADDSLSVDTTTFAASFPQESTACTQPADRYDELPCVQHERLTATRLTMP